MATVAQQSTDSSVLETSFSSIVESSRMPPQTLNPRIWLAVACAHFGPQVSVDCLTALFRFGLIEQVTTKIWVLLPQQIKRRGARYRVIRTKLDHSAGISRHRYYRIANINRAIVEALRYSTKVGLSTAIHAARAAIKSRRTTGAKILKATRALGLERFVLHQWDAIIVE